MSAGGANQPNTPRPGVTSCRNSVGFKQWLLLIAVAGISIFVDLWSKHVAFENVAGFTVVVNREAVQAITSAGGKSLQSLIPAHQPVVVIADILNFTLVLNPGAVFGIGAGQRWFFIVFTGLAIGFASYMFLAWTTRRDTWAHMALGLLIGGGIGNLYDRWVYACVRDFIAPFPGIKFPFGFDPFRSGGAVWPYISNVADALLLIGIGILAIYLWRRGSPVAVK